MEIGISTAVPPAAPSEEEVAAAVVAALAMRAPRPVEPERGWAGYWRAQSGRDSSDTNL